MKILVGKLKRIDVVPCNRVDLAKAAEKANKDTQSALSRLFLIELKKIKKLNKLLASKEYQDFLKFIEVESKKLATKINERSKKMMDEDIMAEIVVKPIVPKLSLKRTDGIEFPRVTAEDMGINVIAENAESLRGIINERFDCKDGKRGSLRQPIEIDVDMRSEQEFEEKVAKAIEIEQVKKIKKIRKIRRAKDE